jgi:release factor glutamine methyltransferase
VAEDRDHGPTIGEVLATAATALTPASSSPRLDAEVLLAHVLAVDRAQLVLNRNLPLDGHSHGRFDRLARRRLRGEPVAYLTGRRGFRFLELDVDSRVLIPRPETEGLVEVGLALPTGASVLDVGAGSGAVGLALKHERADLRVSGVDISAEAVAVAERNAMNLSLDVSFRVGDLLENAARCDAVLANLPYVERDAELPVDVAGFEPPLALFGGSDGLEVIRRLVGEVAGMSWPGLLALEIGETQGRAVAELVAGAGFHDVEVRRDLTGRDRVVVGRR